MRQLPSPRRNRKGDLEGGSLAWERGDVEMTGKSADTLLDAEQSHAFFGRRAEAFAVVSDGEIEYLLRPAKGDYRSFGRGMLDDVV